MSTVMMQRKGLLFLALLLVGGLGLAGGVGAVEVGDKAPDFTLKSTNGEKISLSQFKGKKHVLLEFYGADFSPV